jgi:hypothetical protein
MEYHLDDPDRCAPSFSLSRRTKQLDHGLIVDVPSLSFSYPTYSFLFKPLKEWRMRKIIFGGILFGALGTLSLLGGCATVESVEAAQKTADTALSTATAAQASANDAHQLAGQAMTAASSAQSAAANAQAAADRASSALAAHAETTAEAGHRKGERD